MNDILLIHSQICILSFLFLYILYNDENKIESKIYDYVVFKSFLFISLWFFWGLIFSKILHIVIFEPISIFLAGIVTFIILGILKGKTASFLENITELIISFLSLFKFFSFDNLYDKMGYNNNNNTFKKIFLCLLPLIIIVLIIIFWFFIKNDLLKKILCLILSILLVGILGLLLAFFLNKIKISKLGFFGYLKDFLGVKSIDKKYSISTKDILNHQKKNDDI